MRFKAIISILLLLAGHGAIFAAPLPSPLQPFLVELLDQERGTWKFRHPLGQSLEHPGEVAVAAAMKPGTIRNAVLRLDDPEFPGEVERAVFREFAPVAPGKFELRSGGFAADLTLGPDGGGALSKIRLGSAVEADRIPAALYVSDGTKTVPVRLAGRNGGLKLQSGRIGHVFTGEEPVELHALRLDGAPADAEYVVTDYFRNRETARGALRLNGEDTVFTVPLNRYGSFTVELKLPERSASLRVTRIPEPRKVEPERSFVGMNIFQQQMWYYSYQLPLFAKAGVRWIRPWLHWENTWKMQEPKEGVFDTSQLDALRRRLTRHDQKLTYILYHFSPTLGLPSTEKSPLNEEQMKRWLAYVKRIVAHCPEVNDWEVWNEPDLLARNREFTARFYRDFLIATAQAVREAHPGARVHSLSHAGQLPWLKAICEDSGSAEATDVVTLHSYSAFGSFVSNELPRQRLLDLGGFVGKPQQFNEIATSAYDEFPDYAKMFPGTSERIQAESLPVNWAQSLHFGGPQGKAYWFPSLDPRDSSNPGQWAWDSGNGLLYLGLRPKAAFAALAGMAQLLDGRECLGRMELPDSPVCYAAFSGGGAVVWSNDRKGSVSAMALGCLPDEELKVFDLFGNPVGGGKAAAVTLELDDGPRFLLGSARLGELAHAAREAWMRNRATVAGVERQVGALSPLRLGKGERRAFEFQVPAGSRVEWEVGRDFPGELKVRHEGGRVAGEVVAAQSGATGTVDFLVTFPGEGAPVVRRQLTVSVDRRDYIPDGAFSLGDLASYKLIPGVRVDGKEGAAAPGSMRFDGPFRGRLHLSEEQTLLSGKALHFRVQLKGRLASDAAVSFNAALFVKGKWVGTWMAASLRDNASEGSRFRTFTAPIPAAPAEWTAVEAVLPGNQLPADETTMIFFIDSRGGKPGDCLLVDDLELYQEEGGNEAAIAVPWKNWSVERRGGLTGTDGALLLETPLALRLNTPIPLPVRAFRLRIQARLDDSARIKVALACFDGQKWLGDRVLAATDGNAAVRIPRQGDAPVELSGEIPALPEGCNRVLLYLDGTGGAAGGRCEMFPVELFQSFIRKGE